MKRPPGSPKRKRGIGTSFPRFRVGLLAARPANSSDQPARWRLLTWCGDRAPLLAAVAFFLAMFWPFMRKGEQGEWRRCFLRAAHRLEARQILHWPDEPNTYAYPPAMAMLAVPLAKLPFRLSLAGWYLVNVAAMIAVIGCAWRLIGGPPLAHQNLTRKRGIRSPIRERGVATSFPRLRVGLLKRIFGGRASEDGLPRPSSQKRDGLGRPSSAVQSVGNKWQHSSIAVFWLGLLLASRYLMAPLENQQFDVVIAACLLAGCLALARGNDAWAACWLGAGAAMKCTPLLFAPYLVWRGKARAAAIMLLVAAGINCLPDLVWPQPGGGSYLGDWFGVFLLKAGRSAPGVWDSDIILNQSLAGLINRFVQSGVPLSAAQLPSALTPLLPGTMLLMRVLFYIASGTLLAATLCAFGRPGRSQDDQLFREQVAVESAAVFCLMLLLSPMSSKAHYIVLVLPCLQVARAVVEGRMNAKLWLPPLVVLGPLTAKGITGKALGDLMLAWGLPTWCVLLLLAAMWKLSPDKCFTARVVRCILLPCAWFGVAHDPGSGQRWRSFR